MRNIGKVYKLLFISHIANCFNYFYIGWYQGLSESFLSCGCPKLLLLANTDRLDKPLTIAQMQGKFQLVVLEDVGHTIHEDSPIKTANIIVDFIKRQLQLKLILEKRLNN